MGSDPRRRKLEVDCYAADILEWRALFNEWRAGIPRRTTQAEFLREVMRSWKEHRARSALPPTRFQ